MERNALWGRAALLLAAMIWGSSFFLLKDALASVPTFLLLAIRFGAGFLLLTALFARRVRRMSRRAALHGMLCGVLLFAAYAAQTIGLRSTTPGKNAFLTTVYCVLVPFLGWALFRQRPHFWNGVAAVMCLAGIGLVSLSERLTIGFGDGMTLVSGVFYALHVLAVGRFARGEDAIALTAVQFGTAAVCDALVSLMTETLPSALPTGALAELVYLAVFPTTVALLLQNVGQSVTPAAPAAILLSLESVFGALFSALFAGERPTPRVLCGFALIFLAVVAGETRFSFLFRQRKDESAWTSKPSSPR